MPHLKNLEVERVSLVDRAAVRDPSDPTEPQRFVLFKRDSGAPSQQEVTMPETATPEELSAALKKAEDERDELAEQVKALEKAAEKPEPTEPAKIDKSQLAPEVREMLDKAETERETLLKKAEDAERIAKEERDQRIEKEFIAKAESDFRYVGGDSGEFGKLLKSASEKLEKDEFEALEGRLKAADEQVRSSNLFKEQGAGGDPTPGAVPEVDKLEKRAEEIRKADTSLSSYEAMHLAMREDRQAQSAYLASVR